MSPPKLPPKLSVCVPTWNGALHIEEALRSILRAADHVLEILVCDDASDDATLELVRAIDDPKLRILANTERVGLARNWNRALAAARGEYIALFGQDDIAGPHWAETLVTLLDEHPEAALAFGQREFVFEDARSRETLGKFFLEDYPRMLAPFRERTRGLSELPTALLVEEAMRLDFEINLLGEPSFAAFRRDHPAAQAGFAEHMGQLLDWEFWIRLFQEHPVAWTEETIGSYRLHASGASHGNYTPATYYREFGHVFDCVLSNVPLSDDQRSALLTRQEEVRRLRLEHEASEASEAHEAEDPTEPPAAPAPPPREKILHVVHGYLPEHDGGTERYVQRLARAQSAAGHEVLIASGSIRPDFEGFVEGFVDPKADPKADPEAQADPLPVFRISQKGVWAERWDHGDQPEIEAALAALIAEHGIQLVHVHHWLRLSRGIVRTARAAGCAVVLTLHDLTATCPRLFRVREDAPFCERELSAASCLHCVPRESYLSDEIVAHQLESYRLDMRAELAASSAIVVPSEAHRHIVERFAAAEPSQMHVLPHPRLDDAPLPAAQRSSSDRLRIAHWGYHVDFKGQHVLLEALQQLGRPEEIELAFWGDGDDPQYRDRLAHALAALTANGVPIDRRARFSRDDLAALEADLAVFPSLAHESWSFVVDEALGRGIPVLVSDSGAPRERIGAAGASFPAGDAAALAAQLSRLLDDRAALASMQSACSGSGQDIAEHVARLSEIYAKSGKDRSTATAVDHERRIRAAELRRLLQDRGRHLGALYRATDEECRGLRKDAQEAFRLAIEHEARHESES